MHAFGLLAQININYACVHRFAEQVVILTKKGSSPLYADNIMRHNAKEMQSSRDTKQKCIQVLLNRICAAKINLKSCWQYISPP